MTNYLVGYDLDRPDQEYTNLINAIKAVGGTWWHCLDSTWIVQSNLSAADLRDALWRHMGNRDKLFVTALQGASAWMGFDNECSSWLKSNL